jgi:DNA polymerase I-like protein with 3'-5' exonuclease and polymerase domains
MTVALKFPVPRGKEQYDQYMKLAHVAMEMTTAGWRVDLDAVARHRDAAIARQKRMGEIFSTLSHVAELGADGQTQAIKDYFWKELEVPVVSVDRKTKKPKLDAAALLAYASEFEDDRIIQSAASLYGFRKAGKTIAFCNEYAKSGGRIHPAYNVTGTKGSRWSCSNPNIQQLPAKAVRFDFGDGPEDVAVSMKDCLVSDEGFVLVDADWAALELYLQTYIAGAKHLVREIDNGGDLHMYNARIMFGDRIVPQGASKKTHKLYRNVAKLAFGFAYNASDHVAQVHKTMKGFLPDVTEQMCKRMRKAYFDHHSEFPSWQARTKDSVDRLGFVDTPLLGRRLYLPGNMRGYNQALNSQCQITGGDLANASILSLRKNLRWDQGEQIRAQVHDCFVLQTRPEWVVETADKLVAAMTQPIEIYGLTAKFVAEPAWGYNWGNMRDFPFEEKK